MSELSRHLKKKTVAAFLEKAEKCLLKTGDYLALVDGEGKELYRTGESITGVTGVTCAVLMVAGEPIGELRGGSHWSAKHLEFLRFGLQAMIDAEHTRRLIAEETLEQYRELSLLQRAAASLNDTLDPRLVARALLELLHESKEENHTVGAYYACCGKKETALLPLATLGEYDATLNEIAESSLVNDIVAKGKAEIINHLTEDPRWQAGKTLYEHVLVAPIVASEATVGLLLLAKYTGGRIPSL